MNERKEQLRLLLKAGASIPFIWTLPSGEALAAQSSFVACTSKEEEERKKAEEDSNNGSYFATNTNTVFPTIGDNSNALASSCWSSLAPSSSSYYDIR